MLVHFMLAFIARVCSLLGGDGTCMLYGALDDTICQCLCQFFAICRTGVNVSLWSDFVFNMVERFTQFGLR